MHLEAEDVSVGFGVLSTFDCEGLHWGEVIHSHSLLLVVFQFLPFQISNTRWFLPWVLSVLGATIVAVGGRCGSGRNGESGLQPDVASG